MTHGRFRNLLEPFHIGKVRTRNRIIKTASGTSFWNQGERRVSEKGKSFYEALARGGVGLIMLESPIVEYPFDEPGDVRLRIDDDRYISRTWRNCRKRSTGTGVRSSCSSTIADPGFSLMPRTGLTWPPPRSRRLRLSSICTQRRPRGN